MKIFPTIAAVALTVASCSRKPVDLDAQTRQVRIEEARRVLNESTLNPGNLEVHGWKHATAGNRYIEIADFSSSDENGVMKRRTWVFSFDRASGQIVNVSKGL